MTRLLNLSLLHKHTLEDQRKTYQKKIFHLNKSITIKSERNNKDSILEDEIQLKSYRILQIQNQMVQQIFVHSKSHILRYFEEEMNDIFVKVKRRSIH